MTTRTKLTLDQFLKLPETKPAREYVDGEVLKKPMPTGWHGLVQGLLSLVVNLFLRRQPVGFAGSEIRCIFGPPGRERAYVPDFIFIAAGGADRVLTNGPVRHAPDLAVEILSPDDRPGRVQRKIRFYLANGVRLVWVVDPEARSVTVWTPASSSRTLSEDDTLDGADVLPGFAVVVRDILPPVAPRA